MTQFAQLLIDALEGDVLASIIIENGIHLDTKQQPLLLTDQSFKLFTDEETCGNTCDSCCKLDPILHVILMDDEDGTPIPTATVCTDCNQAHLERQAKLTPWWAADNWYSSEDLGDSCECGECDFLCSCDEYTPVHVEWLVRYWADGTWAEVQDIREGDYSHMSDDYTDIDINDEAQLSALFQSNPELHAELIIELKDNIPF